MRPWGFFGEEMPSAAITFSTSSSLASPARCGRAALAAGAAVAGCLAAPFPFDFLPDLPFDGAEVVPSAANKSSIDIASFVASLILVP